MKKFSYTSIRKPSPNTQQKTRKIDCMTSPDISMVCAAWTSSANRKTYSGLSYGQIPLLPAALLYAIPRSVCVGVVEDAPAMKWHAWIIMLKGGSTKYTHTLACVCVCACVYVCLVAAAPSSPRSARKAQKASPRNCFARPRRSAVLVRGSLLLLFLLPAKPDDRLL